MQQPYAKRARSLLAGIMIAALLLSLAACSPQSGEEQEIQRQEFYLNTLCTIRLMEWEGDAAAGEKLVEDAFALCGDLEQQLSRTVEGNDIWRINEAGGTPVEVETKSVVEVLRMGLDYSELSGGRFDITVGELAELWNFSGNDPKVPEEAAIREAAAHVDYKNVEIVPEADAEGWMVTVKDPWAKIDLGAVAKGYIAETVCDYLRDNGAVRGIVDFGGNIACVGAKADGEPWIIGIRRPVSAMEDESAQEGVLGTVTIDKDGSAVTSGTYERCFEENGVLYHHVLDPRTGYPCDSDVKSVTVIGKSSARCDGMSTVCLLLGREAGLALVESMSEFEAVFVDENDEIYCTSGAGFEPL